MSTLKVSTISPLGTDATKTITIGNASNGDVAAGVFTNVPAFVAWKTADQTIGNSTDTKVTFEGEQLDTGSVYDTSLSRFTPGIAGYYFIGSKWRYDTGTDFTSAMWVLKKNGTSVSKVIIPNDLSTGMTFSTVIYSDADDYFEMFANQNSGGNVTVNGNANYSGNADQGLFYGFRVIGA